MALEGISGKQVALYAAYTVFSPVVALVRIATEIIAGVSTMGHAEDARKFKNEMETI